MIFIKFKKFIVVALAVLCVVVSSCVSAFAATTYNRDKIIQSIKNSDKVKEVTAGKYYFATVLQGTYTFVDIYVTSSRYLVADNSICIPNSDCALYRFTVSDDSEIFFREKVNSFSDYFVTVSNSNDLSDGALLYSNYDLKTTEGAVFFDNPTLLKQLLRLIPSLVGEKVVGDMAILTVCGIGCLALLISLPVLLKTLHKFLN